MLLYVNVLPPLLYKNCISKIPLAPQANPIKYLENYLYCNPQGHYQGNPPFELSIEELFRNFVIFK
jgi:hypothetical protein